MNDILSLDSITIKFGGVLAINNLTMRVPSGKISGVIGPNGAGKTTLFNVITRVVLPAGGAITFNGAPLPAGQPHRVARQGITRTFQNIRLFRGLTVREHLLVMKPPQLHFGSQRVRPDIEEVLRRTNLWEDRDRYADELPYGLQRRVEIARALVLRPKLLLLDEPVAGLNQGEALELSALIQTLCDNGLSILLIEHDMQFVMPLCRKLFVLNFGSLIASGDPASIQVNPAVLEAYLGEEVRES